MKPKMIYNLRDIQPEPLKGRLLVFTDQEHSLPLLESLERVGLQWDRTADIPEARHLFFAWGGHDAILVGPGISAGKARSMVHSLREMDPNLPIFTFLDAGALGDLNPAPVALNDLDPASTLGQNILFQRLQRAIQLNRT